ncbi:MAG: hypothetical protein M3Q07_03670 [Pseudobdellovibrionaceae bacterium]|nr:hypothetical protein [Pseudobdellovibrionaceae bacterium]
MASLLVKVPMTMVVSGDNTTGKAPEYDMVWLDQCLVVTAVFGKYESGATEDTDFGIAAYNGHSGLGRNIRALARMGSFQAGQYKIFFINGCDTFAYADDALWDAHAAVNPDSAPTKYLDVITNAMPSYFHSNAENNVVVIRSLLERQKTYREILADFDRRQRALVMGEEDNAWPEVF